MVDCEHFFDGYKANPDYALACARAAFEAGARWVVLCDTNGGTQPVEVREIVAALIEAGIPGDRLGIHAHNDTGQAVANSLAAVEAGVRQIQGTLNGIGERCGNANLVTLIPTLVLKPTYRERFETAIDAERLEGLTRLSHSFDELLNRSPFAQAPYVGASAFATKAGIHASALLKDPRTYEHVPPESVGNLRKVMVSDQGGRSNFINALKRRGIAVAKDDPRLDRLISVVKEREALGYAYEGADAQLRAARPPHAGLGAGLLRGRGLPRHGRAPVRRQRQPQDRLRSRGEGGDRRRADGCRSPKDMGPSMRSTSRCARTSASTRARSRTSNWSTTRCASSTAAPRPSPAS